jgi:hypothetical protein
MKFRKKEIERYKRDINYIREEMKEGRHIIACLGSRGLTFTSDIDRFCRYASQVGALDISEAILKHCPNITI